MADHTSQSARALVRYALRRNRTMELVWREGDGTRRALVAAMEEGRAAAEFSDVRTGQPLVVAYERVAALRVPLREGT